MISTPQTALFICSSLVMYRKFAVLLGLIMTWVSRLAVWTVVFISMTFMHTRETQVKETKRKILERKKLVSHQLSIYQEDLMNLQLLEATRQQQQMQLTRKKQAEQIQTSLIQDIVCHSFLFTILEKLFSLVSEMINSQDQFKSGKCLSKRSVISKHTQNLSKRCVLIQ